MANTAIDVHDLSKLYHLHHDGARYESFRDLITGIVKAPFDRLRQLGGSKLSADSEFWALSDITFSVRPGEVVGIVGRNGAGKSTLLKVLSRIVEPTRGKARLKGRIASLLEVGTGFHPELSGRENIYLNGSILGMKRREIDARFDEIVAFSEVEKFLDTPVKRYSSGMYVRLAFAVAAHLEPEILIVDEVLAVGDAEFQKKCLGKLKSVASGGDRTVLFVSHNMSAVGSLCDRAILLDQGKLIADGPPEEVIKSYLVRNQSDDLVRGDLRSHSGRAPGMQERLVGVRILNRDGAPVSAVAPLDPVAIEIELELEAPLLKPRLSLGFDNSRGERVFTVASYLSPSELLRAEPKSKVCARFEMPPLYPGEYTVGIGLSETYGYFIDRVDGAIKFEILQDQFLGALHPYHSEMGAILVRSQWDCEASAARS